MRPPSLHPQQPDAKSDRLLTEDALGADSIETFVLDFPDPEWSTSVGEYRVNVRQRGHSSLIRYA